MPTHDARTNRLRERFGLGATSPPPIAFTATPSGKVWGGLNKATPPDRTAPTRVDELPQAVPEQRVEREEAKRAFVAWLERSYPGLVPALLEALGVERVIATEGLGETQETTLLDKLIGAAQTILPTYLQYDQQREILDLQLDRARAGLPPLEVGEFAPSVQVGLDQDTIRSLADEAAARAQATAGAFAASPLTWVALGGAGLLLFSMMKRRRR